MNDDTDRPAIVTFADAQMRAPRGESLRRLASWRDLYRKGAPEQERLEALGSSLLTPESAGAQLGSDGQPVSAQQLRFAR